MSTNSREEFPQNELQTAKEKLNEFCAQLLRDGVDIEQVSNDTPLKSLYLYLKHQLDKGDVEKINAGMEWLQKVAKTYLESTKEK